MDGAAAGGGKVYGDTMNRRGESEEKTMKVAPAGIRGMASGAEEFSYTRNSLMQSQAIDYLKPILEQEIMELELLKDWSGPRAIRMADFGCSVGANPLRYVEICYRTVCRARLSSGRKFRDEVQYFFCDLPSNDFNTLFLQLEDWRKTQATSMEDFCVTAVAGSFFRRLLPRGSLHVAISTFAVQWSSQVPDAVLDKSSPAYNKGRVWIDGNKNAATLQAFAQTGRQDLRHFLLSRAHEVVPGGLVLVYAPGRLDKRPPQIQWTREEEYSWAFSRVFEGTWDELIIEGIVEEEKRDSFNIPSYFHTVDEVKVIVESTNAFHIKRCEIKRQSYFPANELEQILTDPEAYGRFTKNFIRSLMNLIMVEHIGEEKCLVFFERLEKNAAKAVQEKKVSDLPMDCILAVLIRK